MNHISVTGYIVPFICKNALCKAPCGLGILIYTTGPGRLSEIKEDKEIRHYC